MILQRTHSDSTCTVGELQHDDGTLICVTLERPWLDNHPMTSRIPAGQYVCDYTNHPRHGWVYQVMDVPNRSDILLHVGNRAEDTEGCILLGLEVSDGQHAIDHSKDAFTQFMLEQAGVASFPLTIKDVA